MPKSISDEHLRFSASFREHGRFPLLSYFHKTSKSCLIRSAQPLTGMDECRCKEDEALMNAMLTQRHRKGWILDTRHPSIAKSAQSRGERISSPGEVSGKEFFFIGGGCEPERYYALWSRLHRHLDKHIVLQDSFIKLMEGNDRDTRWSSIAFFFSMH